MAAAATAIAATGCIAKVVVGTTNQGGGGAGSSTVVTAGNGTPSGVTVGASTVVTTGSGQPNIASAVALMASELPPNAMPCGGNPCTPPVDTLFIDLANLGNSCANPIVGLNPAAPTDWVRQIGLPVQYQVVGTYSLSDPAIYFTSGESFSTPGTGAAASSGGIGAGVGTIEIVSIDKNSVHIRIQGTALNDPSEDGDFVAPRCTPLP